MTIELIYPEWPAPECVKAISTTRIGGVSLPPYDSFNLATHVGDKSTAISSNRQLLVEQAKLPEPPRWLNQTHSTTVINSLDWELNIDADACYSNSPEHICTVMTADCMPVLICNKQGSFVAAVHAGWRGLANGIIENSINCYNGDKTDLMCWLGPAIGPNQFEVGSEVYTIFTHHSELAKTAFVQTNSNHYLADIYQLAELRIKHAGIRAIYGGNECTVSDPKRFFSYRRDGNCGRMASMIWIDTK